MVTRQFFSYPPFLHSRQVGFVRIAGIAAVAAALVGISSSAVAASICIDPGHGGHDPGAVGCGLKEAPINLSTSLKLEAMLKANGVTVYMTRTTDVFVALGARAAYANSKYVDRFSSIHTNSATASSATGIETYCVTGSTESTPGWQLASAIQTRMLEAWPLANRKVKTASFTVLVETSMPATLTELAFIVNCSVDAQYLGNDAHLQSAACAHLKAITGHFGISGNCEGGTVEPSPGKAMGAIFEDTGSGTADMSKRLPGASATVKQTGTTMTVDGSDAFYTFELTAGTYDIEAKFSGYEDNTVSCTVTSGETAWCSIGLKKAAPVQPEPQPEPQPEAGPDVQPERDVASEQPVIDAPLMSDARADARGDVKTDGKNDGSDLSTTWTEDEDGCGCVVAGGRQTGAWGGLLLMAALFGGVSIRRRRGTARGVKVAAAASVVSVASVVCGTTLLTGCNGAADERQVGNVASSVKGVSKSNAIDKTGKQASQRASSVPGPTLTNTQRIVEGGYSLPTLSPDAQKIALTRPGLNGLWIVRISGSDTDNVVQITDVRASGYLPVWRSDSGAIGWRDASRASEVQHPGTLLDKPRGFADLTGRKVPSFLPQSGVVAHQTPDDRIEVVYETGGRLVDNGADKYFSPLVSSDGKWVVFTGISTGIHLYDVEKGKVSSIGAGTHPSFSGDANWVTFERTHDDGHEILAGDLFLCDLRTKDFPVYNVTQTMSVVERMPSLSADGSVMAYVSDGGIYVGRITW